MEREVVERLAMDRVGGELSEDGVQLLEWYLAGHPEAQGWAAEIETMYAMCAETVAGDRRIDDQMTVARMDSRFRGNDRRSGNDRGSGEDRWSGEDRGSMKGRVLKIGRWAAVIMLALGAGIIWGRWSVEQMEVGQVETIQVVQAESKEEGLESKVKRIIEGDKEASESESGFWETKIVATLGAKPRVKREEPVQEEGFWSNIRGQYRKDNYHE